MPWAALNCLNDNNTDLLSECQEICENKFVSFSERPRGYDPRAFPSVAVTVDIAVMTIRSNDLQLLLIQRGEEPFRGSWALPGGFVRPDEDLAAAAARELAEETGVHTASAQLEQLGSYGGPNRDPRMRVITIAYWAVCSELPTPLSGGDAASADLFPASKLEKGGVPLAFDHDRIVRDAIGGVRAKLETTALAARFCPREFTIADLRRVYEAVWNTTLDAGNFQRKVRYNSVFELIRPRRREEATPLRGRPASLWTVGSAADATLDVPFRRRRGTADRHSA